MDGVAGSVAVALAGPAVASRVIRLVNLYETKLEKGYPAATLQGQLGAKLQALPDSGIGYKLFI